MVISLILCSCHTDFTDFTDFICKAPVLTIRVISVIRVTTSHPLSLLPPLSPWRGAGGEASPLLSFGYCLKKNRTNPTEASTLPREKIRWVSAIISYETVYSGLNLSV